MSRLEVIVYFLAADAFLPLLLDLAFFTPVFFAFFGAAAFLTDFFSAVAADESPAAFFPRPLAAAIMSFTWFVGLKKSDRVT